MLNHLFEAALLNLSRLEAETLTTESEDARLRRIVETQIKLAEQALRTLKSVHTDIEALRVYKGVVFSGTGDCEFGHEDIGVKLNWPNLAILSDEIDCLLQTVIESSTPLSFVQRVDPQQLKINAAEVVADIAFTAGHLYATGKLVSLTDSLQLMSDIALWAYAFEAVFNRDRHGDDYMELVDEYATFRLHGEHDKAEVMLKSMSMKVAA